MKLSVDTGFPLIIGTLRKTLPDCINNDEYPLGEDRYIINYIFQHEENKKLLFLWYSQNFHEIIRLATNDNGILKNQVLLVIDEKNLDTELIKKYIKTYVKKYLKKS